MELTEDGRKILTIVQPLLELTGGVSERLAELAQSNSRRRTVGLATAFEQAIFSPYLKLWEVQFGSCYNLVRKESPKLIKDVAKGKLAAAFVALPLDICGLFKLELDYAERLCAFIPTSWPEAKYESVLLSQLSGKPMFWFQRKRNPLYFDYMLTIFNEYKFTPIFMEEPVEYDVLLARISFGDGWALLPESFAKLKREGVEFIQLNETMPLYISLGFVCKDKKYLLNLRR